MAENHGNCAWRDDQEGGRCMEIYKQKKAKEYGEIIILRQRNGGNIL